MLGERAAKPALEPGPVLLMPHPTSACRSRKLAGDGGSIGVHPLVHDELSRISEGSREGVSVASSTYYSAASGTPSSALLNTRDRHFFTAAGSIRTPQPQIGGRGASQGVPLAETPASAQRSAEQARSTSKAASAGTWEDADFLRRIVKAFVELGVRGRRVQALRRDGQEQAVVFRLSRQVDSFEIEPEGGKASQTVDLAEVAAVYAGDDARLSAELSRALPGLDGRCAVMDLRGGKVLALRFPPELGGEATKATAFVRCMQLFVQEVQREKATGPPAPEAACERPH